MRRAACLGFAALAALLASCSVTPPRETKTAALPPAPKYVTPLSSARSVAQYEREIAARVQSASAGEVYPGHPQFFLRAVIVYQLQIDAEGRLVRTTLFRAPDRRGSAQLVRRALASAKRAAPFDRPSPELLGGSRTVALMETWLFNDDGRFQLRAVARSQQTADEALGHRREAAEH